MENPLLWPIMGVLRKQPSGWKVHTLSTHLQQQGLLLQLDEQSDKDLFKRNFLIMNALFQLQELCYPEDWLQVEAMDIVLHRGVGQRYVLDKLDPLREYYTSWQNYEADGGEVRRLLNEFWTRYRRHMGTSHQEVGDRQAALRLFELPANASATEIRRRWRKLAMRWHPDRSEGCAKRFRQLCQAWHILR
nr:DNA-J related domain-containing protein [Vibrio agarilyticus]